MGDDDFTDEDAKTRMQAFMQYHASQMSPDNFDVAFVRSVVVRSAQTASPGVNAKAVYAFKIPPKYSNTPFGIQTTHGGAIATFFDWLTSMVVVANNFEGWESMGLTRRLDVTYFKPAVEGENVLMEGEVLQIGKRMATIRGVLRREKDGVVIAVCQHDKALPTVRPESPPPSTKL